MANASTEVALYNRALSLIGSTKSVASTSESSTEAETCLLWYDDAKDVVLHAARWPSTRVTARLQLASERSAAEWGQYDPEPGWKFSYALPSDLALPWHLANYARFVIGMDQSNNKRLYTDVEDAILVYGRDQDTITNWSHLLKMAIIHTLAAYICIPLTGKLQRANVIANTANNIIMQGRVELANSEDERLESVPDWIAARGFVTGIPDQRYYYPLGPLLTLTGAAVE